MTELKTLKDISYEHEEVVLEVCNVPDLKQEAIKWIKRLDSIEKGLDEGGLRLSQDNTYKAQINWIKHFFNISDTEVKLK